MTADVSFRAREICHNGKEQKYKMNYKKREKTELFYLKYVKIAGQFLACELELLNN